MDRYAEHYNNTRSSNRRATSVPLSKPNEYDVTSRTNDDDSSCSFIDDETASSIHSSDYCSSVDSSRMLQESVAASQQQRPLQSTPSTLSEKASYCIEDLDEAVKRRKRLQQVHRQQQQSVKEEEVTLPDDNNSNELHMVERTLTDVLGATSKSVGSKESIYCTSSAKPSTTCTATRSEESRHSHSSRRVNDQSSAVSSRHSTASSSHRSRHSSKSKLSRQQEEGSAAYIAQIEAADDEMSQTGPIDKATALPVFQRKKKNKSSKEGGSMGATSSSRTEATPPEVINAYSRDDVSSIGGMSHLFHHHQTRLTRTISQLEQEQEEENNTATTSVEIERKLERARRELRQLEARKQALLLEEQELQLDRDLEAAPYQGPTSPKGENSSMLSLDAMMGSPKQGRCNGWETFFIGIIVASLIALIVLLIVMMYA